MKNKPNMYRVHYRVMEGDNYAGGWGNRVGDVRSLRDVAVYDQVTAVYPMYMEVSKTAVPQEDIDKAIADDNETEKTKALLRDVAVAEKQLKKARAALNKKS